MRMQLCHRVSDFAVTGARVLVVGLVFVWGTGQAQESPVSSLGRALPVEGRGELLLSELNCVACHSGGAAVEARLQSKTSPFLGENGITLTPQFIRAYLNDPHSEGQGRTMPDVLHGLRGAEKEQVIDELVHYLISRQRVDGEPPVGLDEFKLEQGRQLFHSVGCVACHAPQESLSELASPNVKAPDSRPAGMSDRFAGEAVPIGLLDKKTTVSALAAFLQDPLANRPSGRMPSLGLSESEATAIAMYLLRGQATALFDPNQALQPTRGLRYTAFEFGRGQGPNEGGEDFVAHFPGNRDGRFRIIRVTGSGIADRVSDRLVTRAEYSGLLFSGNISITEAGEYTFYANSDDGSRVYVGSELVVRNDGDHGEVERSGTIRLSVGDHPFKVTYYNAGGGGALRLMYSGPGLPKQPIPEARFSFLGQPMEPLGGEEFVLNASRATAGRRHFATYGCAQCHDNGDALNPNAAFGKTLQALNADATQGCLSATPSSRASKYFLREFEREALRQVIASAGSLNSEPSALAKVNHSLNQMNCFACHERDGRGGPSVARAEYFGTTTEVDLGDEGRLPPHLNAVGAKLRPEWTSEVLLKGGAVRPYMATRMQQFGEGNVGHLPALFDQVDDPRPDDSTAEVPLIDTKYGRRLVGTKGMACITCHNFGPFPSLGIPAIDLTQMSHRLKRSWFREYLIDPASLRPGTRMPTFFPGGESVNEEIFDGDTERQIQALWGFLEIADAKNPPDGLVQGKKEIVAESEARIYRNFIQGAGPRAIGVGYPEKANLAFDANQMRLAMIWQGPFIDMARHSSGRGQGFEPPLGHNVLMLPEGPPMAFLPDRNAAWPSALGREGGYQFRGYRLDEARRPTFLYRFRNIDVEDYTVAVSTELDAKLTRHLHFESSADPRDVWIRVAIGDSIEKREGGRFVVDGRLHLSFVLEGRQPLIRRSGGQAELLIPIEFRNGESRLEVEMIW